MSDAVRLRLFVHVEEPSMKEVMETLLPRLLDSKPVDWKIIDHGSKQELLKNLTNRLQGYRQWGDPTIRVLVLVDRDDADCHALKSELEQAAHMAGLATKTTPDRDGAFRVVNRIVIEELEAWFFGDVPALSAAYPRVSLNLASNRRYRDPDAIGGGTSSTARRRSSVRSDAQTGSRRKLKEQTRRRFRWRRDRWRGRHIADDWTLSNEFRDPLER